jgi:hypothetical protein
MVETLYKNNLFQIWADKVYTFIKKSINVNCFFWFCARDILNFKMNIMRQTNREINLHVNYKRTNKRFNNKNRHSSEF